jgi:hypothetical protein
VFRRFYSGRIPGMTGKMSRVQEAFPNDGTSWPMKAPHGQSSPPSAPGKSCASTLCSATSDLHPTPEISLHCNS